eukprot:TRINITY_DN9938_c0_g1_i1.p1 TRINITY_DN9938_c0_g1~~TRINITY_DN9938_c0_g1_i1.p1  ORF type:complete len:532 (+),score=143.35 TRINITY_DN9938_c0_g1_i1:38-1597(+)
MAANGCLAVRVPSGKTLSMELQGGETVLDVKKFVAAREKLPMESITMRCKGRCVDQMAGRIVGLGYVEAGLEAALITQKSVWLTYILWLVGWWCGLHHWYLEREGQAFLWMTSLGGFGIGSALDFFFIPGYVREANGEFYKGSRGFGFFAFCNYLTFAIYYAWLLSFLGEWPAFWVSNIISLATLTFGRKTIGFPNRTAFGFLAIVQVIMMQDRTVEMVEHLQSFIRRCFAIAQTTRPDDVPSTGRKSVPVRLFMFIGSAMLICVTSHYIEFEYGGKQTNLAESVVSGGKILSQVFQELYKMGWRESFESIYGVVQGEEKKALDRLGLQKGATPQEIKKAWRKLTFDNHPDRNPDAPPGAMNEINQAYETLNRIYKLRGGKADDEDSTRERPEAPPRPPREDPNRKGGFTFTFGNRPNKDHPEPEPPKKQAGKTRSDDYITDEEYLRKLELWTAKAAKKAGKGKALPPNWYGKMSLESITSVLMARRDKEANPVDKQEIINLMEYMKKARKQREAESEL